MKKTTKDRLIEGLKNFSSQNHNKIYKRIAESRLVAGAGIGTKCCWTTNRKLNAGTRDCDCSPPRQPCYVTAQAKWPAYALLIKRNDLTTTTTQPRHFLNLNSGIFPPNLK